MADKYPSISPYAYCAWNPIKLVDQNGCEFTETMEKYVQVIERYCHRQISSLLNVENRTAKQNETLNELQNALDEISKMREDKSTLYTLVFAEFSVNDNTKGVTKYAGEAPCVGNTQHIIQVSLNTAKGPLSESGGLTVKGMYDLAHELKHCYQFYNKELIYAVTSDNKSVVYNTEHLEEAAFKRGSAFGSTDRWINAQSSIAYKGLFDGSQEEFTNKYANCTIIKHE